jgi:chromosome segregation ATPase
MWNEQKTARLEALQEAEGQRALTEVEEVERNTLMQERLNWETTALRASTERLRQENEATESEIERLRALLHRKEASLARIKSVVAELEAEQRDMHEQYTQITGRPWTDLRAVGAASP